MSVCLPSEVCNLSCLVYYYYIYSLFVFFHPIAG